MPAFVEVTWTAKVELLVVTSRPIVTLVCASRSMRPLPASKTVPFAIVNAPVVASTVIVPLVLLISPAAVKFASTLPVRLIAPVTVVIELLISRLPSASSVIVPLPVVFRAALAVRSPAESSERSLSAFRSTLPDTVIAPPRTVRL